MRLDEIFIVRNGIASSELQISSIKRDGFIPYVRPASTQQRTIAGWVNRLDIDTKNIYPPETIFVSTNGEGSHSYTYVSRFDFIPNSDVSVLIPHKEMSLYEKIFYAKCITLNRWKFSYGRKPKGERLKRIELPDVIPSFVRPIDVKPPMIKCLDDLALQSLGKKTKVNHHASYVRVDEIFDVVYGTSMELCNLEQDINGINFVSRTGKNNGVSARVKKTHISPITTPALTVAVGGSVLETFLQTEPFYTGFHVFCLYPKLKMSHDE